MLSNLISFFILNNEDKVSKILLFYSQYLLCKLLIISQTKLRIKKGSITHGSHAIFNVCNFVLQNPATYWHAKDYDQANHLLKKPPLIEEIDPKTLKDQLDLLLEREKTYSSQLRFSPNYITPNEIVRYYSNQSSYKDYRCYTPWTKMAFSAYGDIFSCPHYRLGSFDDENNISPLLLHSKKVIELQRRQI